MADYAREEMRNRTKDPKDSWDEHLAKCWTHAFICVISKEQGTILIKSKDNVITTLENV
jgi:hypothetical protein